MKPRRRASDFTPCHAQAAASHRRRFQLCAPVWGQVAAPPLPLSRPSLRRARVRGSGLGAVIEVQFLIVLLVSAVERVEPQRNPPVAQVSVDPAARL